MDKLYEIGEKMPKSKPNNIDLTKSQSRKRWVRLSDLLLPNGQVEIPFQPLLTKRSPKEDIYDTIAIRTTTFYEGWEETKYNAR